MEMLVFLLCRCETVWPTCRTAIDYCMQCRPILYDFQEYLQQCYYGSGVMYGCICLGPGSLMKSFSLKINRRFSLEALGVWASSGNSAVNFTSKLFLLITYPVNGVLYLQTTPSS